MCSIRILILSSAIFMSICIHWILASCKITLPNKRTVSPRYYQLSYGVKIPVPYSTSIITLKENDLMLSVCIDGFKSGAYGCKDSYDHYNYVKSCTNIEFGHETSLIVQCINGNTYYDSQSNIINGTSIECNPSKIIQRRLLGANNWCNGTSLACYHSYKDVNLGLLCYNSHESFAHTLYYTMLPADHNNISYFNFSDLSTMEINGEKIKVPNTDAAWKDMTFQIPELYLAHFEVSSLVQAEPSVKLFNEFNIIWWSNLRLGNWKRFILALQNQNKHVPYYIATGASGHIAVPDEILLTPRPIGLIDIPLFIWTYVQAVDTTEEFVFIGYNSPFYELHNATEYMFCENICDSISWLYDGKAPLPDSIGGVTFCCSPEDVRLAAVLDKFPKNLPFENTSIMRADSK